MNKREIFSAKKKKKPKGGRGAFLPKGAISSQNGYPTPRKKWDNDYIPY